MSDEVNMGSKILVMAFWNSEGATFRPKGKTVHWKWAFGMQKAVLGLSFGSNPSCQNPDFMSNFENMKAFVIYE